MTTACSERVKITKEEAEKRGFKTTKKARKSPVKRIGFDHDPFVAAIHMLRVNIKSLAAEAKIIRIEEKRCGIVYESNLRQHRIGVLRSEARVTLIALALLRGKKFREIDQCKFNCDAEALAIRVFKKLASKLGGTWHLRKLLNMDQTGVAFENTEYTAKIRSWMFEGQY